MIPVVGVVVQYMPLNNYLNISNKIMLKFTVDLEHMRTVRKERHAKFAEENAMSRYNII